jgi:Na+-translocating ferredoxin:NAD+ oxidoreductase RnfG subunit
LFLRNRRGVSVHQTPRRCFMVQQLNKPCFRWLLLVALFFVANHSRAERYLTNDEAKKLCFPQADRFEERVHQFTTEQKKAIEKKSGQPVRLHGQRYWIAYHGTNVLGVLVADHVLGKHEIIDYVVALAPDGKILQVEILEYRESHGYEIRGEKWREQFKGKTSKDKLRLNGDIYNISGATISCRSITDGIKRVLATFELVLRPALPADRVSDHSTPPKS